MNFSDFSSNHQINRSIKSLKLMIESPSLYKCEYFLNLRNQIDVCYAKQKINEKDPTRLEQITLRWSQMIQTVNKFELKCSNNKISNELVEKAKKIIEPPNLSSIENIQIINSKIGSQLFSNRAIYFFDKNKFDCSDLFNENVSNRLILFQDSFIAEHSVELFKK